MVSGNPWSEWECCEQAERTPDCTNTRDLKIRIRKERL